ncbi:MAG: class B sortase [Clostridiales bacterium]|nr:class B sortase [Clostridiales bacterium]
MKTLCGIVKVIETVMRVIVAVVAVIIILFAAYSLYDTFYINQHAFSSVELKQYKPVPVDINAGNGKGNGDGSGTDYDEDSFARLKEVNDDARGWLTIYDTNIDYPVVQGSDDLEYASKDIFGKTSITGAIYLKTDNSEDLSDPYNVIFGHHMDNGAMFGDLEKYKDEDYFNSHLNGWLYAGGRYYRLDAFAVMMTDAYDENVYSIDALTIDERIDYISTNSVIYKQLSDSDREALELFESEGVTVLDQLQKFGDPAMVLALSTCESAITNGRIVVFCMATPVDAKDLPGFNNNGGENDGNNPKNANESPSIIDRLTAIGHPFGSDKWAFLNIVCVIYCICVVLPFRKTKYKFSQSGAAKKARNLYSGYGYSGSDAMAIIRYGDMIKRKLRRFRIRVNAGTALEIFVMLSSVLVFFLTEDMTTPVVMCDKYTPIMIGISALMFVIDVICFIYRDTRILTPDEVTQMGKPEGTNNGN